MLWATFCMNEDCSGDTMQALLKSSQHMDLHIITLSMLHFLSVGNHVENPGTEDVPKRVRGSNQLRVEIKFELCNH